MRRVIRHPEAARTAIAHAKEPKTLAHHFKVFAKLTTGASQFLGIEKGIVGARERLISNFSRADVEGGWVVSDGWR